MPTTASTSLISATDLNGLVCSYMNDEDASQVYEAFLLAAEAHEGVVRKSGEFYIFHPLEVAYTLADLHMDVETICAALLHDVIEDTEYTKNNIVEKFGPVVADLVDGVTKLAGGKFTSRQEATEASFHKMMAAMTQDFRVVLIKLADRLHNVKTLGVRKADARRRIAQETLDIHVPLARRLGMNTMRKDLQVTAFKHLFPWRSKLLQHAMDKFINDNAEIHQEIIRSIAKALLDKNIKATAFRWEKNIFKLYKRIKNGKGRKQLDKQTEALELRVLVNSADECYSALGVLHHLFHPKLGSFKDFIATPKGYGFQALQTALITPQRQLIFVQIQSHEMYQIAQYGITAHWRYPDLLKSSDKSQEYLNRWLHQVEEIQQITGNAAEFLEDMKADLFLSEIYVSTPKGETKVLAKGSTPVDFAYAIHTEVGNKCVRATVDGEAVRLNTPLSNGATVEIITDSDATPHSLWLSFVVTAKARSSIRSWVKKRKSHEFIIIGKQILEKALSKFDKKFSDINESDVKRTLDVLNLKDTDALFTNIAKGNQFAKLISRRLVNDNSLMSLDDETNDTEQTLIIKGTEGLVVHLQDCCRPIPADTIVAQLDEITGIQVHRSNCPTLTRNTNETMAVAWGDDINKDAHFLAPLNIQVRNRVGVLSHVTDSLEKMRINIEDINISGDSYIKDMYFLLQVKDAIHLRQIAETLNNLSHVLDVTRPFTEEHLH